MRVKSYSTCQAAVYSRVLWGLTVPRQSCDRCVAQPSARYLDPVVLYGLFFFFAVLVVLCVFCVAPFYFIFSYIELFQYTQHNCS